MRVEIEIGDYIVFKSATRSGYRKARRKVNGFWGDTGMPTVGYEGWSNFAVRQHEIIEVQKAEAA
jgi:hypothetical protein